MLITRNAWMYGLVVTVASVFLISSVLAEKPGGDKTNSSKAGLEKAKVEGTDEGKTGAKKDGDDKPGNGVKVIDQSSSEAARARGEINFDDLKFELEKDEPFDAKLLTPVIKELNGRKVKLRGYILPATLFKEKNIDQFVLVRDNQECCFGPGAALFDCVIVEMVPGKTTDFVTFPVTVEGKFKIDTESYKYPGGVGPRGASHFAVFKIAGEAVE